MGNKQYNNEQRNSLPLIEGYVKTFKLTDNPKEMHEFFSHYKLIVFENILSEEEIDLTIDNLWDNYPDANRRDETTWHNIKSPTGFVDFQPINGLQVWKNRQHPNVVHAYKLIYGILGINEPLIACLDRGNLMLPTVDNPEWTIERLYHFDCNPWIHTGNKKTLHNTLSYEHYLCMLSEGNQIVSNAHILRSVLSLSDSTIGTGGFECVPGFDINKFCRSRKPKHLEASGYVLDKEDKVCEQMQKVTMKPGSMVIFSADLPHTMYPNESKKFRYAQYLRMIPKSLMKLTSQQKKNRKELIAENMPADLEKTAVHKEIFYL